MRKARNIRHNTPDEERDIRRGIENDPDNSELSAEDFKRMRPAAEACPEIVTAFRRGRGPNKAPTKEAVTIRLSREVIEFFKAQGKGWQTRINNELLKLARKKAA